MLESQLESIKAIAPNKYHGDIQALSFKIILKGLAKLGLVKGDVEELFKNRVHFTFMPHSLSHYIGFKVHDVGFQRKIRDDPEGKFNPETYKGYTPVTRDLLYPGVVLTIEPGLYFIPALIEKAKADEEKKKFWKVTPGIIRNF